MNTSKESKFVAACNREVARIKGINATRINDMAIAERAAYWAVECRNGFVKRVNDEVGHMPKAERIESADVYLALELSRDHSDKLKIANMDLRIKGTYKSHGFSYVAKGDSARQSHGGRNVTGPWCSMFPLCTAITSSRLPRRPETEVTDGDVISINCDDYRVRIYQRDYIALDLIEKDGSLTPVDR